MKKIISADNTFFSRSETGLIFLIAVILFPIWMLYLLLFLFMSEWQQSLSLVYATENILPLAILGMLVPRVCRALPWRPEDRVSFFITHTGIGILFATFGAAGAMALFSIYLQMIDAQMTIFDYDPRVLSWQFFVAFLCYIAIASASYVTYTIEQLREEEFKRLTADRLLTSTELKALKAQLNPHFLFNTLHSLITLTKRDAEAAAAGLEHFADLMRYIMRSDRNEKVTLSEELDFIDDYIALEKLRLGERLRFIEDVGETAKACAIPSLLLQPLVENSIHHAVARRADGGKIELAARLNDDELTITLTDDGPGFDPQKITEGRGLSLVKKRLATLYNEPDHLKVSSSPGSGATISISIPYEQTV